jgi:hypothetical protein
VLYPSTSSGYVPRKRRFQYMARQVPVKRVRSETGARFIWISDGLPAVLLWVHVDDFKIHLYSNCNIVPGMPELLSQRISGRIPLPTHAPVT